MTREAMKVFTTSQIRDHDAYTIANEPIPSIELMERAATRLSHALMKRLSKEQSIMIFCGIGNNGGDGLVCARILKQHGYDVTVFIVRFANKTSADFDTNHSWLKEAGIIPHDINTVADVPDILPHSIIIDALLGSGLTRAVSGLCAEVIEHINKSGAKVFAVDLPSGLFADQHTDDPVINATHTFTFQLPKLAFFMPENVHRVGEWEVIDIELHPKFYDETPSKDFFTTMEDALTIYRPRERFSHKGTLGHALMVTGSKGMMGAAVLTTKAALRAGVGLVTAYVPQVGYEIMQEAIPEAMALTSPEPDVVAGSPFSDKADKFTSIGIGPGIGTSQATREMLALILDHWKKPIVIDADALNIIALEYWKDRIPKDAIITPHPGEFRRLAGESVDDFDMLGKQRALSIKHGICIVLKRAFTCITLPDGTAHFNSTGSPALATGGSGDVLTGIIAGLQAQGYSSTDAGLLGVWLHGRAGELAAEHSSDEAVIAGDVIEHLGGAFRTLNPRA